MSRSLLTWATAALLLCTASAGTSRASLLSGFDILENGQRSAFTEEFARHGDNFGFSYRAHRADGLEFAMDAATLANPFIDYSITGMNTTNATKSFSFLLTTTFAPKTFDGALHQLSVSVTDASDDGAFLKVHSPATKLAQGSANPGGVDLGIDIGDDCIDPAGGGQTATCNYTDVSSLFAPQVFSSLSVAFAFDISAHDQLSVLGHAELFLATSAVPEPGTISLMVVGIGALLAGLRRRS